MIFLYDSNDIVVAKIDLEKAYNKVDWGFLCWTMKKKGFGRRWIRWIMGCLDHPHFSVMIDGSSKGFFPFFRGLRQRDHLSSFLFMLVTDGFSALMSKARENCLIRGFEFHVNGTSASHLQFAYDTICFVNASMDQITNLKTISKIFEVISGLKVNIEKSSIAGIGMDGSALSSFVGNFGYKIESWPMKYLGMPLKGNPRVLSM